MEEEEDGANRHVIADMTGFQMSVSEADCAAVAVVVNKQLSDGKSVIDCFKTVEELESLKTVIVESKAPLSDQALRKYCDLLPDMIALKEQQKTEVKHNLGLWVHSGGHFGVILKSFLG